ncbi:hypothetical protein TNCV_1003091 [Trichonephila clavipes]|nr:hypothetical protein TNCV_1003091 [Trichonephila clavipes]
MISPHKLLNSCGGVISDPDVLCASEAEILKGLSDQRVTQFIRITLKKVIATIQSESQLPIPISTTTTSTPDNSLNTSASSLSIETRLFPTTFNKFAALSTEIRPSISSSVPLPEYAPTTSNNEPPNVSKIPKSIKQNSKNRKKRTKVLKPEIEIKMAPHKTRESTPQQDSSDEEMIEYNEDELVLDHVPKLSFEYLNIITPTTISKPQKRSLAEIGSCVIKSYIHSFTHTPDTTSHCSASQRSMVTYTGMDTVSLGPEGLLSH